MLAGMISNTTQNEIVLHIIVFKETTVQIFYYLIQTGTVLLDMIFALYTNMTRFILSKTNTRIVERTF